MSAEHLARDVIALGAITGVRATAGPNAAAHLHRFRARKAFTAAAVWESFADKALPLPPRTRGGSLVVRVMFGAACGWLLSRKLGFALLGGASAAAATYAIVPLRRAAASVVPDFVAGFAEDALVFAIQRGAVGAR